MRRRGFFLSLAPLAIMPKGSNKAFVFGLHNMYCPKCGNILKIYPQNRQAIKESDSKVIVACTDNPACPNKGKEFAVELQKIEALPLVVSNPLIKENI